MEGGARSASLVLSWTKEDPPFSILYPLSSIDSQNPSATLTRTVLPCAGTP